MYKEDFSGYNNLKYVNGKFDEASIKVINEINDEKPGFKERLDRISKNFYGFNINQDGSINYETFLLDIKGKNLKVNVIKNSKIQNEK